MPLVLSHCCQAAGKADAVRTALIDADREGLGQLTGEQLEQALTAAGLKFTRHQVIGLRRRMDKDRTGTVTTDDVLSVLDIANAQ